MKAKYKHFFDNEMETNPELYILTRSNEINLTLLAEEYICNNIVIIEDEEEVYEATIDWFNQWKHREKYNN
jgi:hypothetical protein